MQVVDPADYATLLEQLQGGAAAEQQLAFRKRCAWKAFQHCATYDRWVMVHRPFLTHQAVSGVGKLGWFRGRVWRDCRCMLQSCAELPLAACLVSVGSPGCSRGNAVRPSRQPITPRSAPATLTPHTHTHSCSTVAEWLWGAVGEGPAPEQCVPMKLAQGLRYGENPHQAAAFYTDASLAGESARVSTGGQAAGLQGPLAWPGTASLSGCPPHHACYPPYAPLQSTALLAWPPQCSTHFALPAFCIAAHPPTLSLLAEHGMGGVATAVQHHGKEMSYNNYLDADAAYGTGEQRSQVHRGLVLDDDWADRDVVRHLPGRRRCRQHGCEL